MEKRKSLQQVGLEKINFHISKKKQRKSKKKIAGLIPFTKNNSNGSYLPNVKYKIIKLLKASIGKNPHDLELLMSFQIQHVKYDLQKKKHQILLKLKMSALLKALLRE